MSSETDFLNVDTVLIIHKRMITEFGGDGGIRDHGLLESAVAMPRQQFGGKYLHSGLAIQAAAYLFHICNNHAFIDGNKRTALAVSEFFLLLNGGVLDATNKELIEITIGVAEGAIGKKILIEFFLKHAKS